MKIRASQQTLLELPRKQTFKSMKLDIVIFTVINRLELYDS